MLEQYKGKRVLADYDLTALIQKIDAVESVNSAYRFTEKCRELMN